MRSSGLFPPQKIQRLELRTEAQRVDEGTGLFLRRDVGHVLHVLDPLEMRRICRVRRGSSVSKIPPG